jgi:hypothetical protein
MACFVTTPRLFFPPSRIFENDVIPCFVTAHRLPIKEFEPFLEMGYCWTQYWHITVSDKYVWIALYLLQDRDFLNKERHRGLQNSFGPFRRIETWTNG